MPQDHIGKPQKTKLFKKYEQDTNFYLFVMDTLEAPFHFIIKVEPRIPSGHVRVGNEKLKLVQV